MTVSAEVKKVTKSIADLPDGEISIWLEPTGKEHSPSLQWLILGCASQELAPFLPAQLLVYMVHYLLSVMLLSQILISVLRVEF